MNKFKWELSMKKENGITLVSLCITLIVIMIFIGIFYICFIGYFNKQNLTITIKDKYIKNYKESSRYLIVDEENNTYQITDLLFKGKFNSTDIYNQLEEGRTYKIETTGYRIPIFSSYQNINKIELLEKEE